MRPRVFSGALGRGARRGPVCTRCKCGSWPGSMARALGVQSCEIWQITTGSLSDQLLMEPTGPMQTPKTYCSFFTSLLLFLKYHSSHQRLGSRGTTAALQAFPVVTATNGASACGFVRMRVCTRFIVGSYKGLRRQPGRPPVAGLRMRKMLAMVW